ncbi:hypothetical protein OIE52_37410 [Streptomyces canus]|uniref:DUF7674 family protein n=1 Tax=Streptomyces canus TaxID=58343 RepID=UPI0032545515
MDSGEQLVIDLVGHVPELEDLYETHVFNENGEVLPHVFFWDVTQEVMDSFLAPHGGTLDWRKVLDFLEDRMKSGVPEVDEIIVTSFLNYLPYPRSPGHEITKSLGPVMSQRFTRIRPAG